MKQLINYLIKPTQDKLQHFYVGTLIYLFLSIFLHEIPSAIITIILACIWEVYREWKYKYPIDLMDILFSILVPIYFLIKNLF